MKLIGIRMRISFKKNLKNSWILLHLYPGILICVISCSSPSTPEITITDHEPKSTPIPRQEQKVTSIDTSDYNQRILTLANDDTSGKWPVEAPYPLPGAILPYHRIVAYYGNLYSKKMGILGELPKKEMLNKLSYEVEKWEAADPSTPVIPALHYIAVTAQTEPGKNSLYRMRMPFHQIDTILQWAHSINALVFLDVQVGQSKIEEEVKSLTPYLKLPNVHLGIDPEFAMKKGEVPGVERGCLSAYDLNNAINILANLVRENKLPPKILVVHRYTRDMITDYRKIQPTPEVQVVMNMDGFGDKSLKEASYRDFIYKEPVQFTGFKLFYKNDIRNNCEMCTPEEILRLTPKPIYIQYQ